MLYNWFCGYKKILKAMLASFQKDITFAPGELAEWSIAAVLKTVDPRGSGGSNPSFSASESHD